MNKKTLILGLSLPVLFIMMGFTNKYEIKAIENQDKSSYYMPLEDEEHEGTWLQWPHSYTYGKAYQNGIEDIWVTMTKHLSKGENVHIVAYNNIEKNRIEKLLEKENIDMNYVDFYVYETDDVWVRDNGPIFVYDENDELAILDWGFNGWGRKEPYKKSDKIPSKVSNDLGIKSISLNGVVLEGGAMELDGNGTFLATKSSIINKNRNKDLSQSQIEDYIRKYYGARKFIWLDGVVGLDITDFHIDGFAKFYDESTIITLDKEGLRDWGLSGKDIKTLLNSTNVNEEKYDYVYLPLTRNNVKLKNGKNLGYQGSYMNFYIGNEVILVPNYNDSNDKIANEIIQELYPDREVVGIDIRELYKDGGMIHCVTQQQPVELAKNKY
ncbi:agmatine deiminase family protein [Romboutsia weinsteinii]|uniref:Agmatine deiminase family protein n=1 Tax=Romboutsia weinsteinii TaxID=2020949 RepID=A0A371IZY8_9FIRM|nr:agmatine deiminase family protein [Romboutsia weinsteinii]RDY25978.1 agmatine deiminase family protein [Romboutsia weinsteinii]